MQGSTLWLVICGLIIVAGYGYSMDMPQALEAPLRKQPYNLTSLEINLLYLFTFLPVMLTDIPFGLLLDRYPIKNTVLVIGFSAFISEFAIGLLFLFRFEGYLYLVYFFKAIIGISGSSAFTLQGFIITKYAPQYYEFLMGFGLCVPYVLDSLNVMIAPIIFDKTDSISLPWFVGSAMEFLSLIAAIVIYRIISNEQKIKKNEALLQQSETQDQPQQQFKISYIFTLPPLFWIINLSVLVNQISFSIYNNLNDLLINRFKIQYVTAGYLLLIPNFLAALISIISGRIIVKRPKSRRKIFVVASIILSLGTLLIYILPNNTDSSQVQYYDYLVIALFLVSISFMSGNIYTALSSSVSLLTDKRRLGTAWGVIGTSISLGETISPLINGFVEKQDDLGNSYTQLTLIYLIITVVGLCISIFICLGPYEAIDISYLNHSKNADEEKSEILQKSILSQTILSD